MNSNRAVKYNKIEWVYFYYELKIRNDSVNLNYCKVTNLNFKKLTFFVITRFQKLNFKQLWIDRKYLELSKTFEDEIGEVRDKYNEDRSNPPLPRNIPPISGRILWIRQLMKRIKVPMDIYKTRPRVIAHERMQKCIKMFNALIAVFIHYEILYHNAWYKSTEVVSTNSK
jgi:dynein heavy chain